MPKYIDIANAPLAESAVNGVLGIDANGKVVRAPTLLSSAELETINSARESTETLDQFLVDIQENMNTTIDARDVALGAADTASTEANEAVTAVADEAISTISEMLDDAIPEALSLLGTKENLLHPYYFSVTDDRGSPSALTLGQDGRFANFVVNDLLDKMPVETHYSQLTDMSTISIWGASDIWRFRDQISLMAEELGAGFFNGGNNGAMSDTIWGEHGHRPNIIHFPDGIVPATGDPITIIPINYASRPAMRARPVILKGLGVEGILKETTFTRTDYIEGVTQPKITNGPVTCISKNGIIHARDCQIWTVGRNDIVDIGMAYVSPIFVEIVNAYNNHPTADKRILMQGYSVPVSPTSTFKDIILYSNAFLSDFFQERFMDMQGFLMRPDIWDLVGITPTSADLTAQANGNGPPSLHADNVHYTPAAYQAFIEHVLKPRLIGLGWYEEI